MLSASRFSAAPLVAALFVVCLLAIRTLFNALPNIVFLYVELAAICILAYLFPVYKLVLRTALLAHAVATVKLTTRRNAFSTRKFNKRIFIIAFIYTFAVR